jgi:hypothetical protein
VSPALVRHVDPRGDTFKYPKELEIPRLRSE